MTSSFSGISSFFSELFKFRKTSLTALAVLVYIVVIGLDFYANYSSLQVPEPEPLILTNSWYDLQKISEKPHPYTSHANDDVFQHIMDRTIYYAKRQPGLVEVETDKGTPLLFKQRNVFDDNSPYATIRYYESENVLVRIKGKNSKLSSVLLSAHFDSVGTAYGTTDDGMGIASMLGVLDYFTSNNIQPLRDLIFNFNNDEEFGLLGATTFFNHPWSKNVEHFINLEGTGAGGRAILFRATDYGTAKYYKSVSSPFASSLFQEGFSNRVVGSETDYKVYLQNGLKGLDIAFYKPRSLYHTYRDSISTTTKGSLYHMLKTTLEVTEALVNEKKFVEDKSAAVYFDILGTWFIILSIDTLYELNIVLLVTLPMVTSILLLIVGRKGTWRIQDSKLSASIRFPISLGLSILGCFWLSDWIQYKNPMIVSLNYNILLLVLVSVILLVNYLIMNFFNSALKIHDQKLMTLLQSSMIFWVWNVISTIREAPGSVNTGEWISTLLYLVFTLATWFGLLGLCFKKSQKKPVFVVFDPVQQDVDNEETDGEHGEEVEEIEGGEEDDDDDDDNETNEDETTPLISRSEIPQHAKDFTKKWKQKFIDSLNYDWSIQFFLVVPVSTYIIYSIGHSLLQATYQNSQEGIRGVEQVFKFTKIIAILLSFPMFAFCHKINYLARMILIIIVVSGTMISSSIFPYSFNNPLKVSFYQEVNLNDDSKIAKVYIRGVESYIGNYLKDLPSVKESKEEINCESVGNGMEICSYESLNPNLISEKIESFNEMLNFTILKNTNNKFKNPSLYEPLESEFLINVKDNRHCVMTFNSSKFSSFKYGKSPVKLLNIYHDKDNNETINDYSELPSGYSKDEKGNEHYKWYKGIDEVQLNKLDWEENNYHIGIEWIPRWFDDDEDNEETDTSITDLSVNVECYWGEYDKEVNIEGDLKRVLPAYDELMQYSPDWIIYTKALPGLVKIKKTITF